MYSVIASDGKTYGPVDVPTLRAWCAEGRITPNTNIVDAVSGRTMKASDLQDLYDMFPSQGPQQQPAASSGAPTISQPQGVSGGPFGQPYGNAPYGQNPAPYLRAPSYGAPMIGQKSKLAAALLALFLGGLGIHRFYLGYTGSGLAMLLMTVFGMFLFWLILPLFLVFAVWVWSIVDLILILTGGLKDANGYDLA